jgi:hypothetical protein
MRRLKIQQGLQSNLILKIWTKKIVNHSHLIIRIRYQVLIWKKKLQNIVLYSNKICLKLWNIILKNIIFIVRISHFYLFKMILEKITLKKDNRFSWWKIKKYKKNKHLTIIAKMKKWMKVITDCCFFNTAIRFLEHILIYFSIMNYFQLP